MANNKQMVLEGMVLGANLPPEPFVELPRINYEAGLVKVNPRTYRQFYNEGINFSEDVERDADGKRNLLMKYFPRRFGKDGNQPLKNKMGVQIGAIFSRLMRYSEYPRSH